MPGRGKAWRFLLIVLLLAFGGTFQDAKARQDLWLTKAHDARRTGQSRINGPLSIDPAQSWTAEAPGAHTLNIGATVTERGVFFGSWGLSRRIPGNPDPRLWDKSDGKLYGLDIATGASLWAAHSTWTSPRAATISTGEGRTCSFAASPPTRSPSTTAPSKDRPPSTRAATCSTSAAATANSTPSTRTPGASSGAMLPSILNCPTTRTAAARWSLERLAGQLTARMASIEGLADIKSSTEGGNPELQIRFDRDRLAALGLTLNPVVGIRPLPEIQAPAPPAPRRPARPLAPTTTAPPSLPPADCGFAGPSPGP